LKGGNKMKYKLRKANAEVSTLVTTIPKWIVNKLNLKDKDLVNIDLQGKKIIITKEEKENV
jgi:antitoxin component of MazEF toxin-antitoxin module